MSETKMTSRVARKPVTVPKGVTVTQTGQALEIKGPKGVCHLDLDPSVEIVLNDGHIQLKNKDVPDYCRNGSGQRLRKSIAGTVRAHLNNIMHGVTHLFEKKLLLVGVGYKAQAKGHVLGLTLGFSHPIEFTIPAGITVETPSPTEIIVKGVDKGLVGLVSAKIRAYRGPEPYKGKGIRYSNEVIVRKETKKK